MKPTKGITMVVAAATLALGGGDAAAQVMRTKILDGNNAGEAPKNRQGKAAPGDRVGAGIEQLQGAQLADGTYVMVGISSKVGTDIIAQGVRVGVDNAVQPNNRQANMQLLCVAGRLAANGQFQVTAMRHVTNHEADRARTSHHPDVVPVLAGTRAGLLFNEADNNNNDAERMFLMVDNQCQPQGQRVQVFGNQQAGTNNDNFCAGGSAGTSVMHSDSPTRSVVGAPCPANGNGSDDSHYFTFEVTPNGARFLDSVVTEQREERTRSDAYLMNPADPSKVVVSLTAGNTQPPNQGVRVVGLTVNPQNGQVSRMYNQILERYQDNNRNSNTRSVQISSAPIGNGMFAGAFYRTTRRRRRGKGRVEGMMAIYQPGNNGMQIMQQPTSMESLFGGMDPTHHANISLNNGSFMLVSSSVNGNFGAPSTGQVVCANNGQLSKGPTINLEAAIDNAWISNIYGNNPNTQGRNFVSGDMVVADGGMPFLVIPASTRSMGANGQLEDKLGLELVAVPAADIACKTAEMLPTTPGLPGQPPAPQIPNPNRTGGPNPPGPASGGCSAVGATASFSTMLAVLGLALLVRPRRREDD